MKYKRYIRTNLKNKILTHISNNIREYLVLIILFAIGIILGTLYIRNIDDFQKIEINNYIQNVFNSMDDGNLNYYNLLKLSLKKNLLIVFSIGITSFTAIGLPILYLIIVFKGFSIGLTISSIIGSIGKLNGIKFCFSALFLQNLIIIPSIIFLSVSGIKLCRSIIKDRRKENIKIEIIKFLIILFIIISINVFATFIESYISASIFMWIFK